MFRRRRQGWLSRSRHARGKAPKIGVRPASGAAPKGERHLLQAPRPPQALLRPRRRRKRALSAKAGRGALIWRTKGFLARAGALQSNKRDCERKLADLEARKFTASNNLARATYLQSLSAQMQADATMCDMRSRDLNTKLQALEKELGELVSQ